MKSKTPMLFHSTNINPHNETAVSQDNLDYLKLKDEVSVLKNEINDKNKIKESEVRVVTGNNEKLDIPHANQALNESTSLTAKRISHDQTDFTASFRIQIADSFKNDLNQTMTYYKTIFPDEIKAIKGIQIYSRLYNFIII